ncbi:NAD(P)/FAD-dependent oxidoreductase [Candidatus Shikimatogenerans silvanidophilus]|uniref:NAD(P)/FAD-dependent oxidoreductase n=1 Tax=Candidatus Shikimatogenerans silvanidophilus TaxID=2782547 RepID=UPI001BACE4AF|nr:NAD(P)/FAD-dependent oxidoreductase [Candidatus Shikimatogenerans silvanidophilus]
MNIPKKNNLKRLIIVGLGFGGEKLFSIIKKNNKKLQIVIIDKNNYHTFKPLLYQVATFGLEPDTISYPIRKFIRKIKNIFFRKAYVYKVDFENKKIFSDIGSLSYDYLIISTGSKPNYFGNKKIEKFTIPMNSIEDSIKIRNFILNNFEKSNYIKKNKENLLSYVIVGGGPTGVELAGAISEIRSNIIYEYKNLNYNDMKIYLIQSSNRLLENMSIKSSKIALNTLKNMGVNVLLNTIVINYDGKTILTNNKNINNILSNNVIWSAGVKGSLIKGINKNLIEKCRILVDEYHRVINYKDVFAIGDISLMKQKKYPNGHPMIAQTAIQQGKNLANNINLFINGKKMKPFIYNNLGYMAIIGRNKAVFDFKKINFNGFIGWILWIFVHLFTPKGFRNKIIIFFNWILNENISSIIYNNNNYYNNNNNNNINK